MDLSDPFSAIPDQKNNANDMPRWFSDMMVPELLLPPKITRKFGPKTAIFAPKCSHIGIAGSFGALLFGWLVIVAHGLYLARHLFIL